jgi:integrase/recombinase XerD
MTAPEITIFVRHNPDCKYRGDEFSRRCDCRKHFRWTANGVQHRRQAGTRAWAEAEDAKRDLMDELSGKAVAKEKPQTVEEAIKIFLQDKRVQGISEDALAKYTRELGRLLAYCHTKRIQLVQGITREALTGYCATWDDLYPSSQTRSIVRARCRGFLRYCYEAQWTPRIPAMPKIKVDEPPTMPLTPGEYESLLAATATLRDAGTIQRARTLFELMRHTGLAIGDALKLSRKRLKADTATGRYSVVTKRQKTGTHVSVPIPRRVAMALGELPETWEVSAGGPGRTAKRTVSADPAYFFWDGSADIVNTWTRKIIPKVFKAAEIAKAGNMTSHRLRDTFAVDLLEKGVALEDVSKLLGHESIKTTERHYAKWVKGRQDRLDAIVSGTWEEAA